MRFVALLGCLLPHRWTPIYGLKHADVFSKNSSLHRDAFDFHEQARPGEFINT